MLTCKSPRKVMQVAHQLAAQSLPQYSSKFSRHDFTLPQLFACLVLREHQRKSYRGVEALLRDAEHWCHAIGMRKVPDHNTLCRAFAVLITGRRRVSKLLDVVARWFALAKVLKSTPGKPLAGDSTHFESHHVSRHFERRRRQTTEARGKQAPRERPDEQGSRTRRGVVNQLPKAAFAVDAATHLILAAEASTGAGSDHPFFEPLLFDAWRRTPGRTIKVFVADPGFDSERNHRIARLDLGVRSIIPPNIGRRSKDGSPPAGRFRRLMRQRFARRADKRWYGQRWQAETVNSMIKRNLGSALRARTDRRREREMLLRAITHNVMLARHRKTEGRDRAGHSALFHAMRGKPL